VGVSWGLVRRRGGDEAVVDGKRSRGNPLASSWGQFAELNQKRYGPKKRSALRVLRGQTIGEKVLWGAAAEESRT